MSTSTRQIALITGASSGIGAVYADRLAKRGYDLVLVARRAERLQSLAATLTAVHGVQVEVLVADLGSEQGQSAVADVLASNPGISMLVNNAGIARLAPVSSSPLQDALSQIALNISALTRLTHAALPAMLARRQGTIINIASVMAVNSLAVSSVYSGTKAFVLAFSRGLQAELADSPVNIQVVLPAATATGIWEHSGVPLAAFASETVMRTEDLVDAALFALDKGDITTFPSVADPELVARYEASRLALFGAAQSGKVAPHFLPN